MRLVSALGGVQGSRASPAGRPGGAAPGSARARLQAAEAGGRARRTGIGSSAQLGKQAAAAAWWAAGSPVPAPHTRRRSGSLPRWRRNRGWRCRRASPRAAALQDWAGRAQGVVCVGRQAAWSTWHCRLAAASTWQHPHAHPARTFEFNSGSCRVNHQRRRGLSAWGSTSAAQGAHSEHMATVGHVGRQRRGAGAGRKAASAGASAALGLQPALVALRGRRLLALRVECGELEGPGRLGLHAVGAAAAHGRGAGGRGDGSPCAASGRS